MKSGLMVQPAAPFLGVNLRQDRVSLADQDMAKAINADLHLQPGAIVLRLGRSQVNTSALTDLVIRRLAKINSNRYRVAGQSLYCGTTRVINGTLNSNLITTLMPFRPLNDSTTWAFLADDSVMRKVNCTTVGTWGIGVPSQPTTYLGVGTGLTGDYSFRVTWVRLVGAAVSAEGNGSTVTSDVTAAGNDLTVGDMQHPTDSTTNAFGVYRTIANGVNHLLDARVSIPTNNAATVSSPWEASAVAGDSGLSLQVTRLDSDNSLYTLFDWESDGTGNHEDASGYKGTYRWEIDNGYVTTQSILWAYNTDTVDTSLTSALETDNSAPPTASWAVEHQGHAFFCRDASNPHYLWYSKRFLPEQVPATNFLEIGNPDDPLQCALPVGGFLGVLARKTKYRVLGNITSGFVALEAISARGTPAPMATIASEFGLLFVARDGCYATTFASADTSFSDKILPLFYGETVNGMAPIDWNQATSMSSAYYKGKYYLAYGSTDSSTPDTIAVYSRDTKNWYFYDHPMRSLYVEEDTDQLHAGGLDGFAYILETGTSDAGSDIALDVETKDYGGQEKDLRKLLLYLKLDIDTQSADVTVKVYVDDTLKHTATVNTSGRTSKLIAMPQGCMGYHWRLNVTYTGTTRIRIYPPEMLYLPMSAA